MYVDRLQKDVKTTGLSKSATLTSAILTVIEFVGCIQEDFLKMYLDSSTRGGTILNLVQGKYPGQVTELEFRYNMETALSVHRVHTN